MTTQEFVVSVSSDHLHYATVDELPNPFGEGSLGTCTIKTVLIVEEGSCTSQECLIWATGPSGTIAPSLQTLLSNSQALAGDNCLVCSLNGEHYFWKLMESYTATEASEQRGLMGCGEHGDYAVTMTHGAFKLNHTDDMPASQISTGPPNLSQNVLLLYPDEGDGLELLYDAFGTDTGEGCVFSGSHPIVCRVGNSAVKIGREEVSKALSAFKESDPLTGAQSAHSLRSDCCVTPVLQLQEGAHGQWVDVWVPGPTRTTLICGPM